MRHGNMGHLEIWGTWKYGSLGNMGYLEMGHLEIWVTWKYVYSLFKDLEI